MTSAPRYKFFTDDEARWILEFPAKPKDPVVEAARVLISHGWQPVPIPPGLKGPALKDWGHLEVTEQNIPQLFAKQYIGLRLGDVSRDLSDVDIDCSEALRVADVFLPTTGMISGRPSKPRSHRWYIPSPVPRLLQLKDPLRERTAPNEAMIIELRANPKREDAGPIQTLCPPSRHPGGEVLTWENGLTPAPVSSEELTRAVTYIAVTTLLGRYWPAKGEHGHDLTLAAAGAFLRAGLPLEMVEKIIGAAARVAGYERFKVSDVRDTARNLGRDGHVTGWPKFSELVGAPVADRIREWLDGGESPLEVSSPAVLEAPTAELKLPDMPDTVLDGKLGEICRKRLSAFPVAYAWLALLAVAAQLVKLHGRGIRTNVYACLVGPVHSGKSVVVERARYLLGVDELVPSPILDLKAGSAEGLLKWIGDRDAIGDRNAQGVLYCPDELSHLLEKAQIKNASFAYILNSLFYRDTDEITIAHGEQVHFKARLSFIGGVVPEKFDDSFGQATVAGLHDRVLFGQCPSDFLYLYRPERGLPAFSPATPESGGTDPLLVEADVDPEVWSARDEFVRKEKINPRTAEISLRAAAICAAFDGRKQLAANELGPAWELARYQTRVRVLLQPNPGRNFEAQLAFKVLNYLTRYAPNGELVPLQKLLNNTRAYEYGPCVAERTISSMAFGGVIDTCEQTPPSGGRKKRLVRLVVK